MRKSNWIILAILAIASIVFLVAWLTSDFATADHPIDIILSIVWWVVIVAVCIAIRFAENKRRALIRTAFLAPGVVYNTESGIVRVSADSDYLLTLQSMLRNLRYTFQSAPVPKDSHLRFTHIVRTDEFSEGGSVWKGEYVRIKRPNEPLEFASREELATYLDEIAS